MKDRWKTTLFIDDIYDKEMLFGHVIRSTISKGRIKGIYIPSFINKNFTIVKAADIPGEKRIFFLKDSFPVLAEKRINYMGEPILLIAGHDEDEVLNASRKVTITYKEEEPFILQTTGQETTTFSPPDFLENRIIFELKSEKGNVDSALKSSSRVIEGKYSTGTQQPGYSDPQGCFAFPEKQGMTIITPTQWPFNVRKTTANSLALPEENIKVKIPGISPHLDGKFWYPSLISVHAALLAAKSKKPVRLLLSRHEDSLYGPRRAPLFIEHRTGLDRHGNLSCMDVQIFLDIGAYPILSEEILSRIVDEAAGPYKCKNLRIRGAAITTNTPPAGVFTGFGLNQSFFALEMHMNRLSNILDADPVSWKRENLTQNIKTQGEGPNKLINEVIQRSDFHRKYAANEFMKKRRNQQTNPDPPLRGIGFSLGYQLTGLLKGGKDPVEKYSPIHSLSARLDDNEKLHIFTSGVPGHRETSLQWKYTARDILGLEPGNVIIEEVNTSLVPDSGPSVLSHNITIISKLIERACQGIQKKRFRSPLPIEVKRSIKAGSRSAAIQKSWAAAVVELDVHPFTFEINIRGIWITVDCGKVRNLDIAISTIEEGILHSFEWIIGAEGLASLSRITDLKKKPPVSVTFLETGKKLQSSGISELAASLLPAAFCSALSQATGCSIDAIPVLPEKIFGYREE